jgi:hypothetical protein
LAADQGHAGQSAGFSFGTLEFYGSPDAVVKQIREFHEHTGIGVLDLSLGGPGLTSEEAQRSFTLYCQEVLPRIREIGEEPSQLSAATAAGI